MAFNYVKAKKDGWSDNEIQEYLNKTGRDIKIIDMKKKGASDSEIANKTALTESLTGAKKYMRKTSNILESFGLGALNTIPAAGYEIGRGISSKMGNEDAYWDSKTGTNVENPFMSQTRLEDTIKNPTKRIAKQTAGLASWAVPMGKASKAFGLTVPAVERGATKIGSSAISAALTEASQDNATVGSVAGSAAGGALFEAPLVGAEKIARVMGKPEKVKERILTALKPSDTATSKFRQSFGSDFGDELMKNDFKELVKMKDGDQVFNYFKAKKAHFGKNAVDDLLRSIVEAGEQAPGSIIRDGQAIPLGSKILNDKNAIHIKDVAEQFGTAAGASNQRLSSVDVSPEIRKEFADIYKKYAEKNGGYIDLLTANNIKRDLQLKGKSAYTAAGSPSPSSAGYAKMGSIIDDLISQKAGPQYKEMNKMVSFYQNAYKVAEKYKSRGEKSAKGLISQIFSKSLGPSLLIALGTGVGVAGKPEMGAMIAASSIIPTAVQMKTSSQSYPFWSAAMRNKLGSAQVPDKVRRISRLVGSKVGALPFK